MASGLNFVISGIARTPAYSMYGSLLCHSPLAVGKWKRAHKRHCGNRIASRGRFYVPGTGSRDEASQSHLWSRTNTGATVKTVSLTLEVGLKAGMHVYAPEVQGTSNIPISWKMSSSPAWKAAEVSYPKSKMLRLEAIDETVPVYEGTGKAHAGDHLRRRRYSTAAKGRRTHR